jgi:hypothetical protein
MTYPAGEQEVAPHSRLRSRGITLLHRYYSAVRLPANRLSHSLRCSSYHPTALRCGADRISQVPMLSLYVMADPRPRALPAPLPLAVRYVRAIRHFALDVAFQQNDTVGTSNEISRLFALLTLTSKFPCFTRAQGLLLPVRARGFLLVAG